jgi:hypothetical protein
MNFAESLTGASLTFKVGCSNEIGFTESKEFSYTLAAVPGKPS